ncbi:phospholipase A1-IIdelta-like [Chenopodium quinoa]|uniref:phospholipase A1-IIdelta-like n=1 Tax=Chenopodium quinoa TaxID=63459 RepID=UPI000B78065F|nr:phospholipase A1-IIdelta-like [Chenopodium quinoa]
MALQEQQELGLSDEGPTWHNLLGSQNWEDLLDPLNDELRRLIIQCGDFCQVTYDTFINDPNSAYCGSSRYAKSDLLKKTAFPGGSNKYDVVGFLYATARVSVPEAFLFKSMSRERWDRESNWIGYIAVSNDQVSQETGRREIYVAWRGTTRNYEWINVLGAKLQSAKSLLAEGCHDHHENGDDENGDDENDDDEGLHRKPKVMQGWLTIYTSDDPKSPFTKLSARAQLLNKIKQLVEQYKDEDLSIIFTGHSLGATLSVLSAFDIAENVTREIPVSAIIFGCPKVGNKRFKERVDAHPNLKTLHVRNVIDTIPLYPARLMGYVHIGIELEIDSRKSPFLKASRHVGDWHNLQAMLHIVNGWQGFKEEFRLVVQRSIALVNKSCDYLKEECLVPPSWWVEKNKGMVLSEQGEWVLAGPEEIPVPEYD